MEDDRYKVIGELLSDIFREIDDISCLPQVYARVMPYIDREVLQSMFQKGLDKNGDLIKTALASQGIQLGEMKKKKSRRIRKAVE